jgi:hypothetical protein
MVSLRNPPSGWFAALLGAVGALAVAGIYLWTINGEGEDQLGSSRVIFIASCIVAAAALAAIGAFVRNLWASLLLRGLAAFMLVLLTVLGAASIGIALLLPAILALRSAAESASKVPASAAWPTIAGAAVADIAVVALGIASTS